MEENTIISSLALERYFTQLVRSVAYREQYYVPFIALNVFKIFDEKRFFTLVRDRFKPLFYYFFRQHSLYKHLLGRAERDVTYAGISQSFVL